MNDLSFKAWFIFCALLYVAVLAIGIWAVVELVAWVTTK